MKKILIFFLIFINYTSYSKANDIDKNTPIIKQLDKQYLNLIDKNGKITNLKEFNKNGKVLVFEGKNFDVPETMYMFIDNIKYDDDYYNFNGTYTRNLLSDFNQFPYCDNETDEFTMLIIDIKLNFGDFTFQEVKLVPDQSAKIRQLYNNKQFDKLDNLVNGYVGCGVYIYNPKIVDKIKKLLNIS